MPSSEVHSQLAGAPLEKEKERDEDDKDTAKDEEEEKGGPAKGGDEGDDDLNKRRRVRSILTKIKERIKATSSLAIITKVRKILKIVLLVLPEPVLMLMMVGFAMSLSAAATAARSANTCWGFVICYSASVVVVAAVVAGVYMYVVGKLPTRALVSLLMSPLGVWASVVVDTALMRADSNDVREKESKGSAVLRKLVFLHGVVGVTLAIVIQCLPSVCPLVPGDGK